MTAIRANRCYLFVTSILLVVASLSSLTACGGTLEIGIEHRVTPGAGQLPPTAATSSPPHDQLTTAVPVLTPTEVAITPSWKIYSNPAFAVSLEYPAHWQPADENNYVGEDGFFSIGAIGNPEISIDDVAADEAGHVLQPYGPQPIIEDLKVQGQQARLILPSAGANMGDQAALIVRYPEPIELDETVQFFLLHASQDHIRAIAQTLQFHAEPAAIEPATSVPPIVWRNLPPGLIYTTYDGLWRVDANEQPVRIHDVPQAVLSPDGARLLSYDVLLQDAWLLDLDDGAISNLTHTPDRHERCFQWWPARPDVVLFNSTEQDVDLGPDLTGYLSSINTDGDGYRILDAEHDVGLCPFALSSNGQTIAYGGGNTGWIYRWETGPEVFDPVEHGLTDYGEVQIGCPAWSPDGTELAWIVRGGHAPEQDLWSGVGLFHIDTGIARVLHPHEPQGVGWPPAPAWSPDGRWVAFSDGSLSDSAGLWVARVDGQLEEHHLGLGGNPVWSPDGKWLAFQGYLQDGPPAYLLAETATWELRILDLQPDRYGQLVDWFSL